ncbi:methionyl-tRNA synthetase [Candidatus Kinetoplastibacterium blastocrithidii TCC012E]|uniref:Methionine--tRNA ligase n=1 Tax=Candidatus Kinetoplastidibacterium blastocrithidiae TCC012E TaxID=1208922 RepID=M1LAL5_9PROT|nr:methionine--tRNA ligase [Candidatus Kinetoplastibacterium blastocrithidii]AFZ83437.1 methionyl-tRNA synthetase [Candidatus Kinetoplastibacterium blastocrithidii (ex Strigomonas culicis)]AGF49533.1 methionyl-tRNA synthetase [Candidatus Kinetoplastibacterium blastocrithidii TCC012E]
MQRTIFVTTALPYSNGSFHIGHIMEYIQADIWVRSMRMHGHKVYFVSADDAHGAPIMLKAEAMGITPKELTDLYNKERPTYLNGFNIKFDHWHSTDSKENISLSHEIYKKLKEKNLIERRTIQQLYDPIKNMFLADRYIKGTCPRCKSDNQYGDSCEECGSTYNPNELINPYSTLTGATPLLRSSEHLFFKLSDSRCVNFLREWIRTKNINNKNKLQDEVVAKIREWLGKDEENSKLEDWDISRDEPYFGIEIPDFKGKYFYVWLDAPIGYLSSLKSYCALQGIDFEKLLNKNNSIEQVHFIGKDIIYFHTLFWPVMLNFSERKTPDSVYVHGFVTIDGEKMSKSRGTGISPLRYLDLGLNPEWLRYYFASKLNSKVEDIDINKNDFIVKVNSDLVGKYINIASRAAPFITKFFDGKLKFDENTEELINEIELKVDLVSNLFEEREYNKAIREIMGYANYTNQIFDNSRPWDILKKAKNIDPLATKNLHEICSATIARFKALSVMLSPILPKTARSIFLDFFKIEYPAKWQDALILPEKIESFKHMMSRVDEDIFSKLFDQNPEKKENMPIATNKEFINIEDFIKLELIVAKIIDCENVDQSDKLLRLTLDCGEKNYRNVFSGIKGHYKPNDIIGKLVILVSNLKPRKMRFGISEGMVLAASSTDGSSSKIYLIEPPNSAKPGTRIS